MKTEHRGVKGWNSSYSIGNVSFPKTLETRLTQFEEMKNLLIQFNKIAKEELWHIGGIDGKRMIYDDSKKFLASLPTTQPSREQEYKTALEKISKLDYDESQNINPVDRLIEVNFIARMALKP